MKYRFRIWMEGEGRTKKDAWLDALSRFIEKFEAPPEKEYVKKGDRLNPSELMDNGNYAVREEI